MDTFAIVTVNNAAAQVNASFMLPPSVSRSHEEVLFESRRPTVSADRFLDTLAAEYSYHTYCVPAGHDQWGMMHMRADLDHILLTRFNLPSKGHESLVRAQEDWLKNRVVLFERYCLPSMAAQTCQRFSWIVYFDPHSPEWLLDWVHGHERLARFKPYFREEVSTDDLLSDVRAVVGHRHSAELLTTNLDNDDSLAVDFVARIQDTDRIGDRTALYIGDGLIRCGDVLYQHVDQHNAFCSVRESWNAPVTCWADWHNLLPEHMPAVVLRGSPGWLQVVHGANVSNRVRGRRTHPAQYRLIFPGLLDDLPDPPMRQIAGDVFISAPGRMFRESGRAAVKTVISKIAGKRGLDRVKFLWTSARRYFG